MFKLSDIEIKKLLGMEVIVSVIICGDKFRLVRTGSDKSMLGYVNPYSKEIITLKYNQTYEIVID